MNALENLFKELRREYGLPGNQWSLWCKRPKSEKEREEVIMGAVLTQRVNWKNAELVLGNLKRAGIKSLKHIYGSGPVKIERLIKPSGFYKAKSRYLLDLARFAVEDCGGLPKMLKRETGELREELLKLKGIGPETADSILLYGLDKPVFVIDEYTRRLVKGMNLAAANQPYSCLQDLFERNLRKDFRLYQDFHALIVIHNQSGRGKAFS